MQSKYKTLKICLVIFCLLRSSYALGLPEFDGATFFMRKLNSLNERLEGKYMPEPNTGCWIWIRTLNAKGYGMLGIGGTKLESAHRLQRNRSLKNQVCGERSPASKLSEISVRIILEAIDKKFKINSIANYFNVRPTTIGHIKAGNTWKHITIK